MTALIAFLGLRGAVVAAILSALLLVAGLTAGWQWTRAEAMAAWAERAEARAEAANGSLQAAIDANQSAVAVERERARVAAENAAALDVALRQAKAALADARRGRATADATLAEFNKRWGARTATCAMALAQVDSSCPELRSY